MPLGLVVGGGRVGAVAAVVVEVVMALERAAKESFLFVVVVKVVMALAIAAEGISWISFTKGSGISGLGCMAALVAVSIEFKYDTTGFTSPRASMEKRMNLVAVMAGMVKCRS
jgi:hypothetical protein